MIEEDLEVVRKQAQRFASHRGYDPEDYFDEAQMAYVDILDKLSSDPIIRVKQIKNTVNSRCTDLFRKDRNRRQSHGTYCYLPEVCRIPFDPRREEAVDYVEEIIDLMSRIPEEKLGGAQ